MHGNQIRAARFQLLGDLDAGQVVGIPAACAFSRSRVSSPSACGGGCHLPAERRVKQEFTARAAAGDLVRGAAHIDIKDVEPDALFPDKQNCLCHGLRLPCAGTLDGIQAGDAHP